MAKKKSDAAKEAEKNELQRRQVINDFNINNGGKYWIDANKVPTSEDIENAKKEFEEKTKALQSKNDYLVADKNNALRVAKFMKEFISKSIWTNRSWVGVLNFNALMDDFIKDFDENNPKDLILEYPPMQFAYLMFENYGGIGIESANEMAKVWDEYLPIYEKLHELNDWHDAEAKMCEDLRYKWALMEQGYYVVILDENQKGDNGDTCECCGEHKSECKCDEKEDTLIEE